MSKKIIFHVTGFGPFHGVDNNPTTQLVNDLPSYVQKFPLNSQGSAIELASCNVFETSAVGALTQLTDILQKHQIAKERNEVIVFLHLGVNDRAEGFSLEKRGVNEATFRVPDEQGWNPLKQPIHPSRRDITHELVTTLPIEELKNVLHKDNTPTEVSTDAGRFLCNYIYYQSLHFSTLNKTHSLFLHVPSFDTIGHDTQIEYVRSLISHISGCIAKQT